MKDLLQAIQEKGWWMEPILLVLFVFLLNFFLKAVLMRLHHHFKERGHPWKESAPLSLILPLTTAIWAAAITYGLNLFWGRAFGSSLIENTSMIYRIILIVAIAWFLMRWKREIAQTKRIKSRLAHHPEELGKIDAINKIATILIFVVTAFLLLEQTGSSMNSLIALGGIGGLAVAFASQQIISNFFGGVMIYFTQPFGLGDSVQLPEKNIEGQVEEIGWYTTQILTPDKRPLYIPNSLLANALVINPSRMAHRQFKTVLNLRYQDLPGLPKVADEIKKLLQNNERIEKSIAPQVHLSAFGSNGLDLSITAYAIKMDKTAFDDLTQELFYSIAAVLEKNGAQFATPFSSIMFPKDDLSG